MTGQLTPIKAKQSSKGMHTLRVLMCDGHMISDKNKNEFHEFQFEPL